MAVYDRRSPPTVAGPLGPRRSPTTTWQNHQLSLGATLGGLSLSSAGTVAVAGELSATLGALSLSAEATATDSLVDVAVTHLTTNSSTEDGLSFETDSITPTANSLVLAFVLTEGTAETPSLSGNGLTWTPEETETGAGAGRLLHVYSAIGSSPSAGAVTITFEADNARSIVWSIVECANVDADDPIVQVTKNSTTGSQITGTLAALANAHNAHVAGVSSALGGGTTFTPDADFTELGDDFEVSNAITLETEWAVNQATCTPTCDGGSSTLAIISVEVRAG